MKQRQKKKQPYSFNPNRQLLYGITLIIIVPLLVVFNSFFLIRQFNDILTNEQYRQALTIGQLTESLIEDKLDDQEVLKEQLSAILRRNSSLTDIYITRQVEGAYVVWASINNGRIGQTDQRSASLFIQHSGNAVARRISGEAGHYWEVHYPITSSQGNVLAVITMHISTERIDAEAGNMVFQSFTILALIVLVIILLLASNTKLFQYAVLYKRLQEIDKAKDDFISIASHELRTPVSAMRHYFALLLDGTYGKLSKKTKESVLLMCENAKRLDNLVEDLLNVSRLQQGRIQVQQKNIDIVPIVKEVVASLQANAKDKCLQLVFEGEEDACIAYTDPDKLREVLMNIIGNGLKYTEEGSVKVFVEKDKTSAVIKVKDTGIGIAPEDQIQLFEKFYRVINRKTQNVIGTGLGLWLSKEILTLLSGTIEIESIENVGTQATIRIPLGKNGVADTQ